MKVRFRALLPAFTFAVVLPMFAASSPKGAIIYTFKGGNDGAYPVASLVADAQGNLYGTTSEGGNNSFCNGSGCGTVFELIAPPSPSGTWHENILYAFTGEADGSFPTGGLILDSAGNLYGATQLGGDLSSALCGAPSDGCGVVFELSPPTSPGGSWTETVLHTFEGGTDGELPGTSLIFDKSGNLYGTTLLGGTGSICGNCGTIFELSPGTGSTWTESIIYSFMGVSDGYLPTSPLVFDGSGNLYGTTIGTVYQVIPPSGGGTWSLNTINVFGSGNGFNPAVIHGGLLFDPSGNLFVTTTYDGQRTNGIAFELVPPQSGGAWTAITLHTFLGGSDAHPFGFVEDASGNLYGSTEGNQENSCGEIFKLSNSASGWNQTVLHSFSDKQFMQGCFPEAPLVYGKWMALYGTTSEGGDTSCGVGCGAIFGFLP